MIFETCTLNAPFDDLIESIFHFKGFRPDHSIERVVPTGHAFVIFELDGMLRHTFDNESLEPNADFSKAWVSGVHQRYLSISAHDDSEMFVIQFKSFGAFPFLHVPMVEIADRVVEGGSVLNGELLDLRDELKALASTEEKFQLAMDWLRSRYDEKLAPPRGIVDIVGKLQSSPAAKLREIAQGYTGTQKHLISQFRKYVGLTPKQYQRVLRFNDVFTQMQQDHVLRWTDIAHRCGFSDQSHFIKEFKTFSGFNPETFVQQEFDEDSTNFFPLDRNG